MCAITAGLSKCDDHVGIHLHCFNIQLNINNGIEDFTVIINTNAAHIVATLGVCQGVVRSVRLANFLNRLEFLDAGHHMLGELFRCIHLMYLPSTIQTAKTEKWHSSKTRKKSD